MGKMVKGMIKGVNKRVVEITSVDNEYFEKAVLYLKTEKSDASVSSIEAAAREYLGKIVPVKRYEPVPWTVKLGIAAAIIFVLLLGMYIAVML